MDVMERVIVAIEECRCDFCGAEPGERCRSNSGAPYGWSYVHVQREWEGHDVVRKRDQEAK